MQTGQIAESEDGSYKGLSMPMDDVKNESKGFAFVEFVDKKVICTISTLSLLRYCHGLCSSDSKYAELTEMLGIPVAVCVCVWCVCGERERKRESYQRYLAYL